MKIEDVIDRRFSLALGKAGVVGMRPKQSRRGDVWHTPLSQDEIRCGTCGKVSHEMHWSAVRELDGTDWGDCPLCYTHARMRPVPGASRRLLAERPHRVTAPGRITCGSCGQTMDRRYWKEFGLGEQLAACPYCGNIRDLAAPASRRADTHLPDLLALGAGRGTLRCPKCRHRAPVAAFGGLARPVCPQCGYTGGSVVTTGGLDLSSPMTLDELDRRL